MPYFDFPGKWLSVTGLPAVIEVLNITISLRVDFVHQDKAGSIVGQTAYLPTEVGEMQSDFFQIVNFCCNLCTFAGISLRDG